MFGLEIRPTRPLKSSEEVPLSIEDKKILILQGNHPHVGKLGLLYSHFSVKKYLKKYLVDVRIFRHIGNS